MSINYVYTFEKNVAIKTVLLILRQIITLNFTDDNLSN